MSTDTKDYKLFTPLQIAEGLTLKNRIVYAPLTRARSDIDTHVPNELNASYYEQRAGAGLIISEDTAVSDQGYGWYGAPALYTDEQEEGWRKVVGRVHAKGGKVFMQMWHMGRQAHSSFNAKGEVVSASATRYEGGRTRNAQGKHVPFETARALETHEVADVVEMFRSSAVRAKDAGFDGVEIHAANGYLIDQFLQSSTNLRTDQYGGSIENRARFLFEVVDAIKTVLPAGRIGVRLSPNGSYGGMGSEDNFKMFTYVMEKLSHHGLAYLAVLDGMGFGYTDKSRLMTAFDAKTAFKGTVMVNNSYTRDIAEGAVRSGSADLVGFGRLTMANPDLAERFLNDWPLAPEVEHKYYWDASVGVDGYNTFPLYDPSTAAESEQ